MKILVLAKRREEVSLEQIQPHFTAELQAVWKLYTEGTCREFYSRADQGGPAVLTLECESVEVAKQKLAILPLVEMHMLDLEYIPLAPFTNLALLFQNSNEHAAPERTQAQHA